MRWLCGVALTALAACGSGGGTISDGSAGGTGGGGAGGSSGGASGADAGDCEAESTLTASGAFTGTRRAPAAAAHQGTANNTSAVNVSAQFGTPFLSAWSFTFTGAPGPVLFTQDTSGLTCVVTLTDAADPSRAWAATRRLIGMPDQGKCSITFTSVTETLAVSGQTSYCVHGTMEATLPPQPGSAAAGSVTLSASF
jgi:hypothetical protein